MSVDKEAKQNSEKKAYKKESKKTKKISSKEKKKLKEAKNLLPTLTATIKECTTNFPSLVSGNITSEHNELDTLLLRKFDTDSELIGMLEEFFRKIVTLLKIRTEFDKKLSKITNNIKQLKSTKSLGEFKGNMQLLGISLNEAQTLLENYEEHYRTLFSEQAQVQFQLLEQLLLFKENNTQDFKTILCQSLETFHKLNEKISKKK
ncbi:MAG: hypothetical protein U9O98_01165 [Asgard group archaeon]|nr:hypothetical protein [Asgard group archaeon]